MRLDAGKGLSVLDLPLSVLLKTDTLDGDEARGVLGSPVHVEGVHAALIGGVEVGSLAGTSNDVGAALVGDEADLALNLALLLEDLQGASDGLAADLQLDGNTLREVNGERKLGVAPRGDDLEGRVAGLPGELETNLTRKMRLLTSVAEDRAVVLLGSLDHGSGDHRAGKTGSEEVYSIRPDQLVNELLLDILDDHALSTELDGLLLDGIEVLLLATVGKEAHDLITLKNQPSEDGASVKTYCICTELRQFVSDSV
ncbi:hypothetical protein HG530_004528 [Fusarium avenaceum]|nr:hypothetical protein HG530_004528 [Fusarium avenaceum]